MYAIFKERVIAQAKEVYYLHSAFHAGNISLNELGLHQNNKLREVVKYVAEHSPFYREHFKGLTSSDIESLTTAGLTSLPFTTKDDLRMQGAALASAPFIRAGFITKRQAQRGSRRRARVMKPIRCIIIRL